MKTYESHWLYVWDVPEDKDEDPDEWEIIHPLGCSPGHCNVDYQIENTGLRWSLNYSGTPITEPGGYEIAAWFDKITLAPHIGGAEYDASIALVEDGWRAPLPVAASGVVPPKPEE